jgi:hypothetical protein
MAIDFVLEDDGEWRVWHLLKNPFFFAPYERDWVDQSLTLPPVPKPGTQKGLPGHEGEPDEPSTRLYDPYRITRQPRLLPEPPKPYETFDPKDAYLGWGVHALGTAHKPSIMLVLIACKVAKQMFET